MNKAFKIGKKTISKESPAYIIAEMSGNHNGDFKRALKIIDEIKKTGADAVKLQTYTPDTITIDCGKPAFKTSGELWKDKNNLYSLYKEAYTPWEWQEELKNYAESLGLDCFSSPFDPTAIDFMENLNMPAIKIASYEINDIPLIRKAAKTGKPIIISTGIAYLEDIERALKTCEEEKNENVILLKCTSAYPCPYEDMNIKVIPNMAETFECIVGLSDHSLGSEVALGAVALGAKVIEKHITLKRADGGVDSAFSMEAEEFGEMVSQIRNLEKALGKVTYTLTEKQKEGRNGSRSLYVVNDIKKGEPFTKENIRSIRPGNGMHTMHYDKILGRISADNYEKGTPLSWDMLEKPLKP